MTFHKSDSFVPRPSHCPVCILQVIKNWTVGRPGNKATNSMDLFLDNQLGFMACFQYYIPCGDIGKAGGKAGRKAEREGGRRTKEKTDAYL